jgi:hypothetical protein
MGKALLNRQLINGRLAKHIYKHLLQWPLQFKDLKSIDEGYYTNLKQLQQLADGEEDISMLCLNFTVTEDCGSVRREVRLVEGGADIEVTNENLPEYIEACFKHKLMGAIQPQLTELLLGFTDVIPDPLLTAFDIQEFESLLHGLPDIDLDDCKANTRYSGEFEGMDADHPTCQLFWEVVSEMEIATQAWLLEECIIGSSSSTAPWTAFGVPEQNGDDGGKAPKLILRGVAAGCLRLHTNQIHLPVVFKTKKELGDALHLLVKRPAAVFDGG